MTWKTTNTAKGDNKLYSDAKGVVPSLDLRFAEGKTLNDYMTGTPLVDHQRSMSGSNLSAGTFVNSSGLIEKSRTNLITYSEQLDNWTTFDVSVTPDTTTSPTGSLTADLIDEGTSTSAHVLVSSGPSFTSGTTYVISAFFKAGTLDFVQLTLPSSAFGTTQYANYDLINGTVTAEFGGTASITSYANGWYRCSFSAAATSTTSTSAGFALIDSGSATRVPSYTGTSKNLYAWGVQIEAGSSATTYIPTTNLPSAAPRFDHDPTTGESLGLLIEEARTNLCTQSETFTGSPFTLEGATANKNAVDPRGGNNATRITLSSGNSVHRIRELISNNRVVRSFFVKKVNRRYIYILDNNGGYYGPSYKIDLDLGVITLIRNSNNNTWPNYGFDIQNLSNGYYRVWFDAIQVNMWCMYPSDVNYAVGASIPVTFAADGTEAFILYGYQVESGSTFPTSYIPTTGTALTRSADVASITGANFTNFFNDQEGTLFFQYQLMPSNASIANRMLVAFADSISSFSDVIGMWGSGTNRYVDTVGYNVTGTGWVNSSYTPSSMSKYAIGYQVGTSTSNFAFNGALQGARNTTARTFNGLFMGGGPKNYISRLTYFPERLPDATLQAITAS